jgi:hypothetical protein
MEWGCPRVKKNTQTILQYEDIVHANDQSPLATTTHGLA